jgi:hypothetical protein
MALLYGPAVCCKADVIDLEIIHGYPRASDLILSKALEGRKCHQITDTTVRPFLHLLNPTRRPRQETPGFRNC